MRKTFIMGLAPNLPHSCPVSLNASGGTPLTKRGKPFLFCQINGDYYTMTRYKMIWQKVRSKFRLQRHVLKRLLTSENWFLFAQTSAL